MMDGLVVPLDESALIARARGLFMPAAIAVYKGALNAQSDLGSAAAILDRAGAIARDAVALARPSFEASGLMRHANALDNAERDLFAFGSVVARSLVMRDPQAQSAYLLQVAMAANRAMEFADASPLMMGFAYSAAGMHLSGQALCWYRSACENAQTTLRNGASGAVLSHAARPLAEAAVPMLASAHPELDQIYGQATQSKCVRDLSMLLGAAPGPWLVAGWQQPSTRWLDWMINAIGRHVARYSADLWGSVFASLCASTLNQLPNSVVPACAARLLYLSLNGAALRRALHGVLRAEEAGALCARRMGATPSLMPARQAAAARVLSALALAAVGEDQAQADSAVAQLLNDPEISGADAETMLLRLNSVAHEVLSTSWTPFMAHGLDHGVDCVREFTALSSAWSQLPEISRASVAALPDAGHVQDSEALSRWLTSVQVALIEKAMAHSPGRVSEALAEALWCDSAEVSGESFALEAAALGCLVATLRERGFAASHRRFHAALDALERIAGLWQATLDLRASASSAQPECNSAQLSNRLALMVWSGTGSHALEGCARFIALDWLAQMRFAASSVDPLQVLADAMQKLSAALPAAAQQAWAGGFTRLREITEDALAAHTVLGQAEPLAAAAVAALSSTDGWTAAGLAGEEGRCRRDFGLLLKADACLHAVGDPAAPALLHAFAQTHLHPFLRPETRALGAALVDALASQLDQLPAAARERLLGRLRGSYQAEGESR